MLMDEYFSAMKNVLTKAENTQREAILAAADEIANRLEKGGAWHIMDTGHMLMFEAVGRTGGMMAIKPIKITCEIQNPVRYRPSPARFDLVSADRTAALVRRSWWAWSLASPKAECRDVPSALPCRRSSL